jgi:hypothetical protein
LPASDPSSVKINPLRFCCVSKALCSLAIRENAFLWMSKNEVIWLHESGSVNSVDSRNLARTSVNRNCLLE